MRRLVLLVIVHLLASAAPALAYWSEAPLRQKIEKSEVIAVVHVLSKALHPDAADRIDTRRAVVEVRTALKGCHEGERLNLHFGLDFLCSGNSYAPGETWLVFLSRSKPGVYRTYNHAGGQYPATAEAVDLVRRAIMHPEQADELQEKLPRFGLGGLIERPQPSPEPPAGPPPSPPSPEPGLRGDGNALLAALTATLALLALTLALGRRRRAISGA